MRTRPLGQSGIDASVIALGTWAIGGWMWGGSDEMEAIRAIQSALERGINLIDTAPIYGFGHSEIVVGRALKGRRDMAVIATKCGMVCNTRAGELKMRSTASGPSEHGHIEVYIYNNPESIRREVEDSLKRLQTDRIDLYQTHWQEGVTQIEDTMGELVRLRDEGKIRAIGVCNASTTQLERYRSVGRLDSDQEKYSMLDRKLEAEQLPWCERNGVAVLAYSPLALGLLTGTAGPEREYAEGDMRRTHRRFSVENRTRIQILLSRFRPIADAHGCSLGQLVIAWTLAQPGVTHGLVGARNEQQVSENARAADIRLTNHDMDQIATGLAGFELV
ncbi:MAG: aldo/keto reductase [Phycisphaeraceae bacterium]|nr:aldo/keto reductase [Phycisphaeraceae bacterium]